MGKSERGGGRCEARGRHARRAVQPRPRQLCSGVGELAPRTVYWAAHAAAILSELTLCPARSSRRSRPPRRLARAQNAGSTSSARPLSRSHHHTGCTARCLSTTRRPLDTPTPASTGLAWPPRRASLHLLLPLHPPATRPRLTSHPPAQLPADFDRLDFSAVHPVRREPASRSLNRSSHLVRPPQRLATRCRRCRVQGHRAQRLLAR